MPALGIDIGGVEDVDRFLSYTSPARAAAEAVVCSLLHPPGTLWWAPQRGHDIRQYLHAFCDADRIQEAVRAQCEMEERVASATVKAQQVGSLLILTITLVLTQDESQVTLTLTVDQLGNALPTIVEAA
jgi:hypothetical protein